MFRGFWGRVLVRGFGEGFLERGFGGFWGGEKLKKKLKTKNKKTNN